MGWASANPIFDRTAQALLNCKAPDATITTVLTELIDALRDGDWDTLSESMDVFRGVEPVMAAFREAAPDYFED